VEGAPDRNVFDLHRIDRDWIVGEDREVGELARYDAADILLHLKHSLRVPATNRVLVTAKQFHNPRGSNLAELGIRV